MAFQNKVVMITGAAGNLGRAVAAALKAAGTRQALLDLNEAALKKAYPQANPSRLLIPADLTNATVVAGAVDAIVAEFGSIDALCNIAGGFRMGPPVHETPDDAWKLMMDMNAVTLLNAVRAVVPKMLAAGGGRIVNVGAGAGLKGMAHMGAYSASKSAVIRLTEAMAGELRERDINVNCVLPSILDTPQNRADMPDADPRRWVAPSDLAQVILFLCSDGARAIHGAAIPVTGLS